MANFCTFRHVKQVQFIQRKSQRFENLKLRQGNKTILLEKNQKASEVGLEGRFVMGTVRPSKIVFLQTHFSDRCI